MKYVTITIVKIHNTFCITVITNQISYFIFLNAINVGSRVYFIMGRTPANSNIIIFLTIPDTRFAASPSAKASSSAARYPSTTWSISSILQFTLSFSARHHFAGYHPINKHVTRMILLMNECRCLHLYRREGVNLTTLKLFLLSPVSPSMSLNLQ